ncbi:unnamed protein product, partial [Polarella glacialis]
MSSRWQPPARLAPQSTYRPAPPARPAPQTAYRTAPAHPAGVRSYSAAPAHPAGKGSYSAARPGMPASGSARPAPRATSAPATSRGPVQPAGRVPMQPATRPPQGIQGRLGIPAARPPAPAGRQPAAVMQNRPTPVAVGSAGLKRPGSPAPVAQAFKKPALSIPASVIAATGSKEIPKFTVTSSSKKDDIGIQTLVGDYADRGANHGKRFYQKVQKIPGHEDIKVFLYYWDQRDGADFSGWWFGDQVGGTQVWARNASASPSPLRVGWKVPWDAPTSQPGLLFVDPYKAPAAAAVATPVTSPANSRTASPGGLIKPAVSSPANTASLAAGLQARLQKATAQVTQAEKGTNDAVSKSKVTLSAASPAQ